MPSLEIYPRQTRSYQQVFMVINGMLFASTVNLASQARNARSILAFSFPHLYIPIQSATPSGSTSKTPVFISLHPRGLPTSCRTLKSQLSVPRTGTLFRKRLQFCIYTPREARDCWEDSPLDLRGMTALLTISSHFSTPQFAALPYGNSSNSSSTSVQSSVLLTWANALPSYLRPGPSHC